MTRGVQRITVINKSDARRMIESKAAKLVELDYATGGEDVIELSRLGRQMGVAVQFRAQEAIAVESMRALLRGLSVDKDTYRQRHLFCMFDLATCVPEQLKEAEAAASRLGDLIVIGNMLADPYQTWTH